MEYGIGVGFKGSANRLRSEREGEGEAEREVAGHDHLAPCHPGQASGVDGTGDMGGTWKMGSWLSSRNQRISYGASEIERESEGGG